MKRVQDISAEAFHSIILCDEYDSSPRPSFPVDDLEFFLSNGGEIHAFIEQDFILGGLS